MSNYKSIGGEPATANKTAPPPPEPAEPPVEGVFQNPLTKTWEAYLKRPDGTVVKIGSSRFKQKAERKLADAKHSTTKR